MDEKGRLDHQYMNIFCFDSIRIFNSRCSNLQSHFCDNAINNHCLLRCVKSRGILFEVSYTALSSNLIYLASSPLKMRFKEIKINVFGLFGPKSIGHSTNEVRSYFMTSNLFAIFVIASYFHTSHVDEIVNLVSVQHFSIGHLHFNSLNGSTFEEQNYSRQHMEFTMHSAYVRWTVRIHKGIAYQWIVVVFYFGSSILNTSLMYLCFLIYFKYRNDKYMMYKIT